ncbi:MAG TPA: tRNA (adenine-N1)-methyltransferase [Bellilinea sp.]
MSWNLHGTHVEDGDLVQLVGLRHKSFIIRVAAGGKMESHRGVIKHDDLIGKPWGTKVTSHLGNPFFILQPALGDLLKEMPRSTQILYPKEIGFILVTMGIGEGELVVEAGTGSGALTCALAFAVGKTGRVVSYENRPDKQALAMKNLNRLGLLDRVEFKLRDIAEGFDETGVDALFLDVPNPHDYIAQVKTALKFGGFFGSILPTANQVSTLILALRQNNFAFIDILEILLRYYKAEPERFRPVDRMIAHTGFLLFARPVIIDQVEDEATLLAIEGRKDRTTAPENEDETDEEVEVVEG